MLKIINQIIFKVVVVSFNILLSLPVNNSLYAGSSPGDENEKSKQFSVDLGGYKLHFDIKGSGPETIVIECGVGSWSLMWKDFQDELSKHYRVVLYDRAGYGKSDPSPYGRTVKEIARELHEALKKTDLKGPFILMGHSYGGYVVRSYAKQFPEDVKELIYADAAYEDQFSFFHPALNVFLERSKEYNRNMGTAFRSGEMTFNNVEIDSSLSKEYWNSYKLAKSRATHYDAVYNEMELLSLSYIQSTIDKPLDIPLTVITAGNSFQTFANLPALLIRESNKIWMDLQKRQLNTSTKSKHIIIENGTHDLKNSVKKEFIQAIITALDRK
ncbi:MAG: alpha/beta hydrolase [Melioribacteraceae bacterium]|nr:MAG: alpha/beta hydrolase [Melioribacteraceae bacterium]